MRLRAGGDAWRADRNCGVGIGVRKVAHPGRLRLAHVPLPGRPKAPPMIESRQPRGIEEPIDPAHTVKVDLLSIVGGEFDLRSSDGADPGRCGGEGVRRFRGGASDASNNSTVSTASIREHSFNPG